MSVKLYTHVFPDHFEKLGYKPRERGSALSTLQKIESVVAQRKGSLTNKEKKLFLNEAKEIKESFENKVENLSWFKKLFSRSAKKSKEIGDAFFRIEVLLYFEKITPSTPVSLETLPPELILEVAGHLKTEDLLHLRSVDKYIKDNVNEVLILKARGYGYSGNKTEEAKSYLSSLFRGVQILLRDGHLQPVYKEFTLNIEETLKKEQKKTKEQPGLRGLLMADYCNQPDVIKALVVLGADPDLQDSHGMNPLLYAAESGDKEMIYCLLHYGADANLTSFHGNTPLIYVSSNNSELTRLLLEKGNAKKSIDQQNGQARTALHFAAEGGQLEAVKLLLKHGADLKLKDIGGMTSLALAANKGHQKIVAYLLNAGVDADTVNSYGQTPLIHVSQKSSELTRLLLEKGNAKKLIDQQTQWGSTALHYAAEKGEFETVKLLLKYGANPNLKDNLGRTPLAYAADRGHKEIMTALLDVGADANTIDSKENTPLIHVAQKSLELTRLLLEKGKAKNSIDQQDQQGSTALHYAAEEGRLDTVKLLLEYGADPNLKDCQGRSPLTIAAMNGNIDLVSFFLNLGIGSKISDEKTNTPLIVSDSLEMTRLLLEKGNAKNSINQQNQWGNTALHYAVKKGQLETVKLLLKYEANPNLKDNNGMTPLALAATDDRRDIVTCLLDLRVDADTVNSYGQTPLILVSLKDPELTRLLLEKGNAKKSIDHQNPQGLTALHFAAQKGQSETVKLLLEHEANPKLKDNDGMTPLSLAKFRNRKEIVRLFRRRL